MVKVVLPPPLPQQCKNVQTSIYSTKFSITKQIGKNVVGTIVSMCLETMWKLSELKNFICFKTTLILTLTRTNLRVIKYIQFTNVVFILFVSSVITRDFKMQPH